MSIHDPVRVKLRVQIWDVDAGRGVVVEKSGFGYPVTLAQLGPEFKAHPPRVGELLEGVVRGPNTVVDLMPCERVEFDSRGANPDGDAIASELGRRLEGARPDTGLGGGTPDSGRFSRDPRDRS